MPPCTVIIQTNYLPWKGYFDLLARADTVVWLDTVQYTRSDWRNRNRIKTAQGTQWLTVPVHHTLEQRICDVRIAAPNWSRKHFRSLAEAYGRAPFAAALLPELEDWYRQAAALPRLFEVNRLFLQRIAARLGIALHAVGAETLLDPAEHLALDRCQRLVELCRRTGAGIYLSGPAARSYLDPAVFDAAGIQVQWFDYPAYPEYPQLHGPFEHAVSVLDVMLMTGPRAHSHVVPAARPDPEHSR